MESIKITSPNRFGKVFQTNNYYTFLIYLCIFLSFSCKKLVEVPAPITSINQQNVYSSDATAISVLNGIYAQMSQSPFNNGRYLNSYMALYAGLSADEFNLFGNAPATFKAYYQNKLTNTTSSVFASVYQEMYVVNSAIEGISASKTLTPIIKQQLLGEAKFLRAFFNFYLVNLYGDIPLVLSSDYKINTSLFRSPKKDVYNQITSDLKDAQNLLNADFVGIDGFTPNEERSVPTKWAATALLARVYLYTQDYTNAELQASSLLENNPMFSLLTLNDVFLKNSKEAIWQLQPVNAGWNTEQARGFIVTSAGLSNNQLVSLSSELLTAFEPNDQRRTSWVGSVTVTGGTTYYFPFKYKIAKLNDPIKEYEMVFRLGEQYLIRADARTQLGKINDALVDLNTIRKRAGLDDYTGSKDKLSLEKAILHERQIELFSEWGHRWLDIKRTGNIDAIMTTVTPLKGGGTWNSRSQLFPMTVQDLQSNPNLKQTPGY